MTRRRRGRAEPYSPPKLRRRERILAAAEQLAQDFLWERRKHDEVLPRGVIEEALNAGEVTVNQIVKAFREALLRGVEREEPEMIVDGAQHTAFTEQLRGWQDKVSGRPPLETTSQAYHKGYAGDGGPYLAKDQDARRWAERWDER